MVFAVTRSGEESFQVGDYPQSLSQVLEAIDGPVREVQARSREVGLSSEQISTLIAVQQWRSFLETCSVREGRNRTRESDRVDVSSTEAEQVDPKAIRAYLQVMGYLKDNRVATAALRSNPCSDGVAKKLFRDVASDQAFPSRLAEGGPEEIRSKYPELSKSQAVLLQGFVKHRIEIDSLNTERLATNFPFPIEPHNYFGRFLAGGCETPDKAIRHLALTTPFFIRLRPLLEGLSNDRLSYLVLGTLEEREEEDDRLLPLEKEQRAVIHAYVSQAEDLVAGHQVGINPKLTCIEVPNLPQVRTEHIQDSEKWKFAGELFDWLFLDKSDGELLNRRALSVSDEKECERRERRLLRRIGRRTTLLRNEPPKDAPRKDKRKYERKLAELEDDIKEDQDRIQGFRDARSKMKPLVRSLRDDDSLAADIKKFRKEVNKARRHGQDIVFSFLGVSENEGNCFLRLLDTAVTSRRPIDSTGIRLLRNSKFLLSPGAKYEIDLGRLSGRTSVMDRQVREFELQRDDFSSSLRYVTSRILPEKEDPKLAELVDTLVSNVNIPGVVNRQQLKYLVGEACGRPKPKAEDFLEYAFERAEQIPLGKVYSVLAKMRSLGIERLPARCAQLMVERFRHPATLAAQFASFNATYQPDTLGGLPAPFRDLATFSRYFNMGLDSYGMLSEAEEMDRHLRESGVVVIVDSTSYHPELAETIGDEKVQGDEEKTKEIWGRYVRPSERLIRNFALSLIEGRVSEELRNHSLVGVNKEDKAEAFLRAVWGIDASLTPDLAKINRVLGDLTVYDDSAVVVLHADSVKNYEQFRDFIDLLRKYRVKTIVRSREAIPGLPQVLVQPYLDQQIPDRLTQEESSLRRRLGIKEPITREVLEFASRQVAMRREPSQDPLNLVMQLLNGGAQVARMSGHANLTIQDVNQATSQIFHLPNAEQMRKRGEAIEAFALHAPGEILGQREAIRKVADRVKSHIYEVKNPKSPLSLLIPGPTGVGKTELAMKLALAANVPFFDIEGSQFTEPHSLSKLVGSPPGYKDPSEGLLFKFLKENTSGIIFIDEIDKMHSLVLQGLMNFIDKARLTAGSGELVSRPGMMIIGATNAAAEVLNRDMTEKQVKEALVEAFEDADGRRRPEIIARFDPIPMLAIEEQDFKDVLRRSLSALGERAGFINANLRIVDVAPEVVELLFKEAQDVCRYDEKALKAKLGFANYTARKERESSARQKAASQSYVGSDASGIPPVANVEVPAFSHGEVKLDATDFYYDLRHVSRAVDNLAGDSIREMVEEQHSARRKELPRGKFREMRLVVESDDRRNPRIKLVDVDSL